MLSPTPLFRLLLTRRRHELLVHRTHKASAHRRKDCEPRRFATAVRHAECQKFVYRSPPPYIYYHTAVCSSFFSRHDGHVIPSSRTITSQHLPSTPFARQPPSSSSMSFRALSHLRITVLESESGDPAPDTCSSACPRCKSSTSFRSEKVIIAAPALLVLRTAAAAARAAAPHDLGTRLARAGVD
jgi:hypothetical protein